MPPTEQTHDTHLRFGEFTIHIETHGLYRGDDRIHLTPTPFRALVFLVQRRGIVVSKEHLLQAVWGGQRDENTVEQAIRQIRRALGDDIGEPRFIQTISGEGYCFIGSSPVNVHAAVARPPSADSPSADPRQTPALAAHSLSFWVSVASILLACAIFVSALAVRHFSLTLAVANPERITQSQSHILSPLLSDGKRLLYPRYENGRYSVGAVPVQGGTSSPVDTGIANPELCDVASGPIMLLRDLVYSRDEVNPLYIRQATGPAQRVGDVLAYDAAWYPDAKHILFSNSGDVYATDLQGTHPRQLFTVPGNAYWFRWSPDGKTLRFTVIDQKSEETSIWEFAPNGSAPRRLFPELHNHLCCGTWMPGGNFYVFQARVESLFQIWAHREQQGILPAAGNRTFPLITGAVSYRGPLFNKDGSRVFVRSENPKGEFVEYDRKSAVFIPLLPAISARMLAYSPDRQWIAYASLADNNLWRCRTDGTACLQLTRDFKNTVMPSWAPDGQSVTFMGLGFVGKWAIFSVPAAGGPVLPLSNNNQAKGFPSWSPDGLELAFSDVPPVSQPEGIYILNMHNGSVDTLPGSAGYFFPRWSPDGRFLVALHSPDQHLSLFDIASHKWRPIAQLPAGYPNWSHDSRYVYFLSNSGASRDVYRVAVANGTTTKVASLAAIERGPFLMGDWIGLTPDDAPIVVRNITTEDIYAWDLASR